MSDTAENQNSKQAIFRIDVKKEMLEWAIKRAGKTVKDVAKSNKGLRDWLSGEKKPTLRQLEKFAAATYAPFGYLLLSEPPDESISMPHFRTAESQISAPSLNLIEAVQIISQRQDWMRDRLVNLGNDPLEFVGSVRPDDSATQVAHDMREKLGLAEKQESVKGWAGALSGMRDAMENAGIFVTVNGVVGHNNRRRLNVNEFRGFVLADDYAPFVFVNGTDSKEAQMFTLAYELAHVWMGKDTIFDLYRLEPANDQTEMACNKIAAEFLIPEKDLSDVWDETAVASEMIGTVSRRFKVSKIIAAHRALDLRFINKKTFYDFYAELDDASRKPRVGGNFYATANLRIGKRFAKAVISAARSQDILYRDAYSLTGLNRATFEKFAKRLDKER